MQEFYATIKNFKDRLLPNEVGLTYRLDSIATLFTEGWYEDVMKGLKEIIEIFKFVDTNDEEAAENSLTRPKDDEYTRYQGYVKQFLDNILNMHKIQIDTWIPIFSQKKEDIFELIKQLNKENQIIYLEYICNTNQPFNTLRRIFYNPRSFMVHLPDFFKKLFEKNIACSIEKGVLKEMSAYLEALKQIPHEMQPLGESVHRTVSL